MGGGDLNLKKSWHPSTFANLKKVWEAERARETELQQLAQLRKEKEAEREAEELRKLQEKVGNLSQRPERVEWMYSGASSAESPLAEEFLLGRRQHKGPETSASGISRPNFPPSHEKAPIHREHGRTQDIEAKIREDPLFTIMQKERSIIDEVNQNPVMSKRSKESRPNTGRPSDARISKIVHKRRK